MTNLIDDLIDDSIPYCACVIVRISDDFHDDRHENRLVEIRLQQRLHLNKELTYVQIAMKREGGRDSGSNVETESHLAESVYARQNVQFLYYNQDHREATTTCISHQNLLKTARVKHHALTLVTEKKLYNRPTNGNISYSKQECQETSHMKKTIKPPPS